MPNTGGLTRAQIVTLANKRSEGKGKILDLDSEFLLLTQEFCLRNRWYWRRKSLTFNATANTATYDLLDTTTLNELQVEQICKNGVRINVGGNQWQPVDPIFEIERQECAMDDTTTNIPCGYFIEPGTVGVLHLTPTPNSIYAMRVALWALPSLVADAQTEDVPLVPGYLHHILVTGLERKIYKHALGEGSEKFLAADKDYETQCMRAAGATDFATGRIREFKTDSRSVQSH